MININFLNDVLYSGEIYVYSLRWMLKGVPTIWLEAWWSDRIWRVCSFSECFPPKSAPGRKSQLYEILLISLSLYAVQFLPKVCINFNISDMAVAFRLYDIWQSGFIEREEVIEVIYTLLLM